MLDEYHQQKARESLALTAGKQAKQKEADAINVSDILSNSQISRVHYLRGIKKLSDVNHATPDPISQRAATHEMTIKEEIKATKSKRVR